MTCMKSLITGLLSAVALDGVSGVPAAAWQKAFDEPYRPIWMKRVKGYAFVGSHWKGPSGDHGIGDFLSQQGDALKGDRLFFYVQHPTPAKTCCGEKAWGQDDGCSTQALSIYPNAVAISGHCHLSLTDERNVWQGAFTSVGGSALWQVALDSGRENSSGVKDSIMKGRRGDQDGIVTSHVQFVSVYDNHIRIERFDIRNNLPLGEDWVLPLPVTAQTALTDEKRSRLSTPPGPFPSGAEIRQEVLSDRIRLEIPAVCVVAGASPVKDYIVEAWNDEDVSGKLVFSRAVFGPGAFFAAEREQGPVVAEFSRSLFRELGSVCFKVYAREAFGKVNAGLSRKVWLDA